MDGSEQETRRYITSSTINVIS